MGKLGVAVAPGVSCVDFRRRRVFSQLLPILRRLPVWLMCVLAGCSTAGFWEPGTPPPEVLLNAGNNDEAPAEGASKTGESAGGASQARPRTFPQAIRAYLHCLHCPPSTAETRNYAGAAPRADTDQGNGKKGEDKEAESDAEKAKGNNEKVKEGNGNGKDKEAEPAWYSAHAQATVVTQTHGRFHSPYVGENSLLPEEHTATSMTGTLFLDARLWENGGSSGELVFNPEIAGGRGLSGVHGVAGFPNGEITRVGVPEPTPYIARLFYRQTCGFGGEEEKVEEGPNQIPG